MATRNTSTDQADPTGVVIDFPTEKVRVEHPQLDQPIPPLAESLPANHETEGIHRRRPDLKILCAIGLHQGQWEFVAEGDCTQTRTCWACPRNLTRTKHHHKWRYEIENNCMQSRICTRCAEVRKKRDKHERWGPTYSIDSDTHAHECVRCGKIETWEPSDPD